MLIQTYRIPYAPTFDPVEAVGFGDLRAAFQTALYSEDARPYHRVLASLPINDMTLHSIAQHLQAQPRAQMIRTVAHRLTDSASWLKHCARRINRSNAIWSVVAVLRQQSRRLHRLAHAKRLAELRHDASVGQHPFHPQPAAEFRRPRDPLHLLSVILEPGWLNRMRRKFGPPAEVFLWLSLEHLWIRSAQDLENLNNTVNA